VAGFTLLEPGELIGLYLVVQVAALLGRVRGGGPNLATPPPGRTS
jgi:hypothetical protein